MNRNLYNDLSGPIKKKELKGKQEKEKNWKRGILKIYIKIYK